MHQTYLYRLHQKFIIVSFILLFYFVILLLTICFAIFDMTKIFVPIIIFLVANAAFVLAAHSNFNTTIQLIEKTLKI